MDEPVANDEGTTRSIQGMPLKALVTGNFLHASSRIRTKAVVRESEQLMGINRLSGRALVPACKNIIRNIYWNRNLLHQITSYCVFNIEED